MKIFLSITGRFFALMPRSFSSGICKAIGFLIIYVPNSRARVAFSNIKHCFPNLPKSEIREIAYESAKRMVEMGLFVLASPYIGEKELKKRIRISEFLNSEIAKLQENPRPLVLMIPHFCMMESITMLPMLSPLKMPQTGVFYRPFDNDGIESWVKETRERYGIHLLSRKDGLFAANDFLKNKGCVGVLFDQDAGAAGALSPFFGRLASTSEIAEILAHRWRSGVAVVWAKRTGFWSAEIDGEFIEGSESEEILFNLNLWLENKIKSDETARRDWLWLHKRWKTQTHPKYRFQIRHRRVVFEEYLKHFNLKELPRRSNFIFKMPSELTEAVSVLPIFSTLRKARPDAAFTLLFNEDIAECFEGLSVAERVLSLPFDASKRKDVLMSLSEEYPELLAVFDASGKYEFDAKLIRAAQSYGFFKKGGKKPKFVKFCAELSEDDFSRPILERVEIMLKKYGLKEPLDFSEITFKNRNGGTVFDAKKLLKSASKEEIVSLLKNSSKIAF